MITAAHSLPTLSLVTDPANLFSSERGIYTLGPGEHGDYPFYDANIWQEWERPVQVAFREADGRGLERIFTPELKYSEGSAVGCPQRSFALFARGAYGSSQIDYPLFPGRPYETFQSLILRNSGGDWMKTMFQDAAVATLYQDADLETQAYRPVATYLNGHYWGIYNLREKINEHYLASRSRQQADQINLLELGVMSSTGTDPDTTS